ncbi:MAG: helix-turn-helix transcriptional regulator [Bacteroidia bacterium]
MKNNSFIKGTLATLILKLLSDNGQVYGYEVIQKIKLISDGQMLITEGALYPALHKLEQEGLLTTETRMVSGRQRKYYSLSAKGKKATATRLQQLQSFLGQVQLILSPKKPYKVWNRKS